MVAGRDFFGRRRRIAAAGKQADCRACVGAPLGICYGALPPIATQAVLLTHSGPGSLFTHPRTTE